MEKITFDLFEQKFACLLRYVSIKFEVPAAF